MSLAARLFPDEFYRDADLRLVQAVPPGALDILDAESASGALAEVLRAQAQDARRDAKRRLLVVAGRKEVAMLFPLVFLILPVTIVFAVFPGIVVLELGR